MADYPWTFEYQGYTDRDIHVIYQKKALEFLSFMKVFFAVICLQFSSFLGIPQISIVNSQPFDKVLGLIMKFSHKTKFII